jgi:hypothetical protein
MWNANYLQVGKQKYKEPRTVAKGFSAAINVDTMLP